MGIMNCGRKGCSNVLCAHEVRTAPYEWAYICNECLEELREWGKTRKVEYDIEFFQCVSWFMNNDRDSIEPTYNPFGEFLDNNTKVWSLK